MIVSMDAGTIVGKSSIEAKDKRWRARARYGAEGWQGGSSGRGHSRSRYRHSRRPHRGHRRSRKRLQAEAAVDLKGLLVMPGVVDAHIHLGHGADISRPRTSSDAETESAAAAAGGVTTFLSYVISGKPFEPALIDEVCAVTAAGSRVDFGLHLVISTEEQLAGVPELCEGIRHPFLQALHVQPRRRRAAHRPARYR